jgi:GT2 family glycosyltransferase
MFNGLKWLDRCLGSVRASKVQADLFVFDNDSTDGSADYVQVHFPEAKLVRSAENLGFTQANNLGFEYAVKHGYDFVYLLNQDAWLEEGALEKLVLAAESSPDYAVLSPLQMTDGYRKLDYQFEKLYKGEMEVPRIMASHWLVKGDALQQIGMFGELFPYYGQDDDWCNRAHFHGWKIGVVQNARAVHDRALRQESKERIIDRNYRVGSLVRLCDINHPLWDRFLFVSLFTLVKAIRYRSLLPFKHFRSICGQLPAIRAHRAQSRS